MMFNYLKSDKGQVAVEYILMTMVMLTITLSCMNLIKEYMFNGEKCTPGSKAIACQIVSLTEIGDPTFKRFKIRFKRM